MSNELATVDAEVVSIETKINDTLQKNNITETIIAGLKEKYMPLTINGQDDREGYNEVKEARKDCKAWRVRAEKLCKKGREDAVSVQKAWVAKEKEVAGQIGEIEDHLEKQEKAYDAEKEKIKAELKAKHDNQFATRTIELTKMGAAFDGTNFILEDVSYESALIREADDDIYSGTILPKFKAIFDKNEEVKLAAEKEKQEQELRQKAEREELERQQAELKQQQEELLKQQQEAEKQKLEAEQRRQQKEQEARSVLQNKRMAEFLPFYNPSGRVVDIGTLWSLSEGDYETLLEESRATHAEQQKVKQAQLEEQAATKERERIAEEQKQAEAKRQQEEQRRKEELEKASDKDKWQHFLNDLNKIHWPEVTGKYFKLKLAQAREKVEEINDL